MKKQTIQYTSPLDALVAVTKRLSAYENQLKMNSETFYIRYSQGELGDECSFVDWANDYRHYLALRQELEERKSKVPENGPEAIITCINKSKPAPMLATDPIRGLRGTRQG
jgi:hypothetical protein